MTRNLKEMIRERKLSMKAKLTLSLSAIAITLLVSSFISIMEYSRMSSYVSDLIADNVRSINSAQKLSELSAQYNHDLLAVIGDDISGTLPDFRQEEFMSQCDSLKQSLIDVKMQPLTDSVVYAYSAFMLTSLELKDVLSSDFIDTRSWYFERLQPQFRRLNSYIDVLTAAVYDDLRKNSATFERGFYRSIIPGIVSVGAGLILIALLYFFISAYYVRPIYKMLASLKNYGLTGGSYNCTFDGTDQLAELNGELKEVVDENVELRRRNKSLKDERDRMIEAVESVQE